MVSVTPELSSSAVLMVGSQNGPTVWKGSTMPAGEPVAPAATRRPHRLEVGPQQGVVEAAERRQRVGARPPQRGEEGAEEHHFREDEPAHAPAEREVDLVAVLAALALADGLAEPDEQRAQPQHHAQPAATRRPTVAVDPLGGAEDDEEQADRRHHRVGRRRRARSSRAWCRGWLNSYQVLAFFSRFKSMGCRFRARPRS